MHETFLHQNQETAIELIHSNDSVHQIVSVLPKLKTTAKSVQTTAEVCADYS